MLVTYQLQIIEKAKDNVRKKTMIAFRQEKYFM
jgi:hypothetical protein